MSRDSKETTHLLTHRNNCAEGPERGSVGNAVCYRAGGTASLQATKWAHRAGGSQTLIKGPAEIARLLISGDKKIRPSLLPEFAGNVNLIYIDPPFDTGADFSFTATVPDEPQNGERNFLRFTKEPSIIEHKAYRDTRGRGLESYLQWFYDTVMPLLVLRSIEAAMVVPLTARAHCARRNLELYELDVAEKRRRFQRFGWRRRA